MAEAGKCQHPGTSFNANENEYPAFWAVMSVLPLVTARGLKDGTGGLIKGYNGRNLPDLGIPAPPPKGF